MRVLLDAKPLLGKRSGIGRYVSSLATHLNRPQEIEVFLTFNNFIKQPVVKDYDWIKNQFINLRYPYTILRRILGPNPFYNVPIELFLRDNFDLFHGTNFTILPTTKIKSVVTVHDLAYMIYPNSTSNKIFRHHMKWVPYSVHRANRIIADSQQTRADIIRLLHVPEEKVDVVHLAADKMFRQLNQEEISYIYNNYQLPRRYILYVGTIEPRKNLITLIQAFHIIKRLGLEQKLVIIGARGWKFTPVFEIVKELHLQNDIIFLGFINDVDLVSIYNGATCLVLPSIYEGFGLPLLEAMQCGIPVIGSNISSIPEVIGDAGLLVDPMDVKGWVDSILNVVNDGSFHNQLTKKSLARATHFSWDKVAKQTKEVYEKALME